MPGKTAGRKRKGTDAAVRSGPKPPKLRGRGNKARLQLVRWMITKWTAQMDQEATKPGVTELIRLLALEKELSGSEETAREIKVTWVEPTEAESSKSE